MRRLPAGMTHATMRTESGGRARSGVTKSMAKNRPAAAEAGVRRYRVSDVVDVLCDHSLDGVRVRDWLQGIVVQADDKMVAVQFVEDVYLTDGWMVPDRILFCQQGAANIRPSTRRRVRRTRRAKGRRR